MAAQSSDWYRDPEVLVGEIRRGGPVPSPQPDIPGFDQLREVRRGGQGIVYSAMQRSTKRRVAIKVLLNGAFASGYGRRRFEREIDLVAGLQHPNIVRVFDSGLTSDGQPFFVMEFIEGAPLDRHVHAIRLRVGIAALSSGGGVNGLASRTALMREARSAVREALELFAKVGDAVNYAHQRGVIHRDLKPGNILIDSVGEPHVCDFGLAKTSGTNGDGSAPTMTVTGQFMGSLPWASPEQLEADHGRVDIRTDVYSLGVVLYEMLTGRLPYNVSGNIRKVLDNIQSIEPVPPSAVAAQLDSELDTIVLKCLAKDPARRYQSAGELVSDIRHYLAGEPIQAKRDSAWYMLSKTLRRYQLAASIAGIVSVAILAALVVALWSWHTAVDARDQARREASRRAAIGGFLSRMITSVDPGQDGHKVRMLDILDKAAAGIGASFRGEPEVEVEVRKTLAASYEALGMYDHAETQLRLAAEVSARTYGAQHAETLELRSRLPEVLVSRGQLEQAEILARSVLGESRQALGSRNPQTALAAHRLAFVLSERGTLPEAEQLLRAALADQDGLLGRTHGDTLSTLNLLAVVLKRRGALAEADALLREAVAAQRTSATPNSQHLAAMTNNLGLVLQSEGKFDEAEDMLRQTLELRVNVLGEEHPETLSTLANLATLLLDRHKLEEAEVLMRRAVEVETRVLGPDNPTTLTAMNNLAKLVQDRGNLAEAEKLFRLTLDARRRVLGPQHAHTLLTAANLAVVLDLTHRPDDALSLSRDVLDARRKILGENHLDTLISKNNLGLMLQRNGKAEEAVMLFREATEAAAAGLGKDHYVVGLFGGNYGRGLAAVGRYEQAEAQELNSCRILEATFGIADARTQQGIRGIAELYDSMKRAEDAARWRAKITATPPAASGS